MAAEEEVEAVEEEGHHLVVVVAVVQHPWNPRSMFDLEVHWEARNDAIVPFV